MKTIKFTSPGDGHAYKCSEPGDQSGEFVRVEDIDGPEEVEVLPYKEWCKAEKLPVDECSKAVYDHWRKSVPTLGKVIANIKSGHLKRAHYVLGKFIDAFSDRENI